MTNIYKSQDFLIGNTPLMELINIEKEFNLEAKIFAKLEFFNPAGSVKDRVAKAMIEDYEQRGLINKDTVIIEPTSGNTGIGLASVCASKGYKLIIVMPDTMSYERQLLIKAYGASLVLTDGKNGMTGAIKRAEEINKEIKNSLIAGQFVNPVNPKAHFDTTGPEIYKDTDANVDIFVSAIGTGGTITGTGEFLKSKNSNIKIVGIEPKESAVLSGKQAGAHKIQGIGAGFVPQILNVKIIDEIITVSSEDAYKTGSLIGKYEGILAGISSGAALYGAIELAKREENKGKTIVVIFPDGGERYLSTDGYFSSGEERK
ncbi:MAG: cysteine synthase A [Clostridia bacterium]|nr:cysteine synthase A [Clostridia bacterium]